VPHEHLATLRLVDGVTEVAPRWVWSAADPVVNGAVMWGPFSDPRCRHDQSDVLCDGHHYSLMLGSVEVATIGVGPERRVGPQWTGAGTVQVGDIGVKLTRATDYPCVVAAASLGLPDALPETIFDPAHGALIAGLLPQTDHQWSVTCINAAGFSSPAWDVSFRTLSAQTLQLSEVVVDPQYDWNDSQTPRGAPFDDNAAESDRSSPTDEWAELWNTGEQPLDILGYSVEVQDGTPATMRVADALDDDESYCPAGCTPLPARARMVMRLSPSGSNATNRATIILRDALGLERDRLELENGDATSPANESTSACGTADSRAWQKGVATPGTINACPP